MQSIYLSTSIPVFDSDKENKWEGEGCKAEEVGRTAATSAEQRNTHASLILVQ